MVSTGGGDDFWLGGKARGSGDEMAGILTVF
jgi:hypothetical protein